MFDNNSRLLCIIHASYIFKNTYLDIFVNHLCIVVVYGLIIEKQLIEKIDCCIQQYSQPYGLPWRYSASAMYANYDLPNIDTVITRSLFGFIQRLSVSENSTVCSIELCISNCILYNCLLYFQKNFFLCQITTYQFVYFII